MRKIIILVFCVFFLFCSLASAARINMRNKDTLFTVPKIGLVWIGDEMVQGNNKNDDVISKRMEKKFPEYKYELITDKKFRQDLLILAEDKDVETIDRLKRVDYVSVGKKYGYDYVLILPFYAGSLDHATGLFSSTFRTNITLKARVLDVNTGEYIYRMDIVEKGSSGSTILGSASYLRAQKLAVGKCLDTFLTELSIGEQYSVEVEDEEQ